MIITEINRDSIKVISERAQLALHEVARELGVSVEVQGGKFDPSGGTFTPKFVFSVEGAAEKRFALDCQYIWTRVNGGETESLKPEDYLTEFTYATRTFRLTGINLRAPKFPLLGEDAAGKTFKFGQAVADKIIKERLEKEAAA